MDKQGRLTKWEEWEVGASYVWVKSGTHNPFHGHTYQCIGVNKKEGYVTFNTGEDSPTGGLPLKSFGWRKRYRKVTTTQ